MLRNINFEPYNILNQTIYKFTFEDQNIIIKCIIKDNLMFDISELISNVNIEIINLILKEISYSKFVYGMFVSEKDFLNIISWIDSYKYEEYEKSIFCISLFLTIERLKVCKLD